MLYMAGSRQQRFIKFDIGKLLTAGDTSKGIEWMLFTDLFLRFFKRILFALTAKIKMPSNW